MPNFCLRIQIKLKFNFYLNLLLKKTEIKGKKKTGAWVESSIFGPIPPYACQPTTEFPPMQPTSLPFLFFGFADGWVPLSRGLLPQQNTGASGRILGLSSIHCRPQSQQTSVYIAHGSRRDSSSTVRDAIVTSYLPPPSTDTPQQTALEPAGSVSPTRSDSA
jgi:hypothetical protein